jgi:hypothetical protein
MFVGDRRIGMTLPAPTRPAGRGCAPEFSVGGPSLHQKRRYERGAEATVEAMVTSRDAICEGHSLARVVLS